MKPRHASVTLDNISWTAIRAPIDCAKVTIFNLGAADMKLRTDSTDASTEITVYSMQEYSLEVPRNSYIRAADTLVFGQLTATSYAVKLKAIP